jgi:hypothetical protein
MILRLLALVPLAALLALPLSVFPGPPVSLVAAAAGLLGAAGVLIAVPPLATSGAILALIAHAVALLIADARPHLTRAVAMGLALVLFLVATHLAAHAAQAAVGPGVLRLVLRRWLEALALAAAGAAALALAGQALAGLLLGAALPAVTALGAAGALLATAGVVLFLRAPRPREGSSP